MVPGLGDEARILRLVESRSVSEGISGRGARRSSRSGGGSGLGDPGRGESRGADRDGVPESRQAPPAVAQHAAPARIPAGRSGSRGVNRAIHDEESSYPTRARVLVFGMWIADVGRTHLRPLIVRPMRVPPAGWRGPKGSSSLTVAGGVSRGRALLDGLDGSCDGVVWHRGIGGAFDGASPRKRGERVRVRSAQRSTPGAARRSRHCPRFPCTTSDAPGVTAAVLP